jgi:hypothetical protein
MRPFGKSLHLFLAVPILFLMCASIFLLRGLLQQLQAWGSHWIFPILPR